MKIIGAIATSIAMAVLVSSPAMAKGDAAAGKTKSMTCGGCHGADGNSAAPNFPKLAGQGERYLVKQIHDIKGRDGVILRSVPMMTGLVANLSNQDIEDIAAYYASQPTSPGAAKPESVELGAKVYRGGNMATGTAACSACHAPDGSGNEQAGFPKLAGQHAVYLAAQLKAFRSGARANDGDSMMMRGVAARLTDEEIDALSSYISGLR